MIFRVDILSTPWCTLSLNMQSRRYSACVRSTRSSGQRGFDRQRLTVNISSVLHTVSQVVHSRLNSCAVLQHWGERADSQGSHPNWLKSELYINSLLTAGERAGGRGRGLTLHRLKADSGMSPNFKKNPQQLNRLWWSQTEKSHRTPSVSSSGCWI